MDDSHFDDLARSFAVPSRRGILAAVGAAVASALLGLGSADETLAKRKHGRESDQQTDRDRVRTAGKKGKNGKGKAKSKGKSKSKKVTICHNGQTIQVAESALKEHRRHGDSEGPCQPQSPPPPPPAPPPPTESCAATCSGCCNGGTCQEGAGNSACGRDGAACVDCGTGRRCLNGQCVCDGTSCPTGCCDSTGTCRINDTGACGRGVGVVPPARVRA